MPLLVVVGTNVTSVLNQNISRKSREDRKCLLNYHMSSSCLQFSEKLAKSISIQNQRHDAKRRKSQKENNYTSRSQIQCQLFRYQRCTSSRYIAHSGHACKKDAKKANTTQRHAVFDSNFLALPQLYRKQKMQNEKQSRR